MHGAGVFRTGRRRRRTALLLVLFAMAAVFHVSSEQVHTPCGNLPSNLQGLLLIQVVPVQIGSMALSANTAKDATPTLALLQERVDRCGELFV